MTRKSLENYCRRCHTLARWIFIFSTSLSLSEQRLIFRPRTCCSTNVIPSWDVLTRVRRWDWSDGGARGDRWGGDALLTWIAFFKRWLKTEKWSPALACKHMRDAAAEGAQSQIESNSESHLSKLNAAHMEMFLGWRKWRRMTKGTERDDDVWRSIINFHSERNLLR